MIKRENFLVMNTLRLVFLNVMKIKSKIYLQYVKYNDIV